MITYILVLLVKMTVAKKHPGNFKRKGKGHLPNRRINSNTRRKILKHDHIHSLPGEVDIAKSTGNWKRRKGHLPNLENQLEENIEETSRQTKSSLGKTHKTSFLRESSSELVAALRLEFSMIHTFSASGEYSRKEARNGKGRKRPSTKSPDSNTRRKILKKLPTN
ncbi:hypothetical protein AVEN_258532-1 [Araneus ventricosus]|uniref:Uncharacterized protein n=1 Tax=Araneus ventricosus TaxID=182803 RepID=A0A4Y2I5H7_ARAVE|nr:hypothetical protein AVEN_258532-1 [Araneus ventricosus]